MNQNDEFVATKNAASIMAANARTILLAEDDQNDFLLFQNVFERGNFFHHLQHVTNGTEAIQYLKGEGKFTDRAKYPFPSLVITDLKMPKQDGFEVLLWVRKESSAPRLPIVVVTSANDLKNVQRAYSMGANSFLVKPISLIDLKEVIQMLYPPPASAGVL